MSELSNTLPADSSSSRRFAVALSFPGEHRNFVEQVAGHLAAQFTKERVLYDKYHKAEFAAPDLDVYLPNLYRTQSELIVLFLCPEYAAKRWCRLEWRFIRQMLASVDARRIMFLSFGNPGDVTELGILSGDGYLDIDTSDAKEIAEEILKRFRLNQGITPPPTPPNSDVSAIRRRLIEAKTKRELQEALFQAQALVSTPEVKLLIADIERAIQKTPHLVSFANEWLPDADISRIIKYAPAELIGREEELKLLHDAWAGRFVVPPSGGPAASDRLKPGLQTRPHVLTFVALGGEGKTSLVAKWAADLAAQDWPGCDAVFAWSFYSQGTREQTAVSSDLFLNQALTFFGDKDTAESPLGAHEKGEKLAQLVGARRALLILDGLEPLQYAPTSPTPGELKDQGLAALLKGLAATSHGLCVVTTRYALPDLRAFLGKTVREVELLRLARAAGVQLLKAHGVTGSDRPNLPHTDAAGKKEMLSEFEKLVEDVDGHALTLHLMGSFLKRAFQGDIRRRDRVTFAKADQKTDNGHAFRAMATYEKWLADASEEARRELALLSLMGLFDRPATADCLQALLQAPAIAGLTEPLVGLPEEDWNGSLTALQDARLLTVNRDAAGTLLSLDAHPLLREYFAVRVRSAGFSRSGERRDDLKAGEVREPNGPAKAGTTSEAWRAAHRRLYEHLCATTKDKPDATLEDLQPLYQAVAHGCQAGLQQEACDKVYFARLQRREERYSTFKLGALGSDLGAIACFFETPWSRVSPALTEADQAWLLNETAFSLRALGRLTEALEPMRAGIKGAVKLKDWDNAARYASNLSELELTLGEVAGAVGDAEQSVTYADRSGDAFMRGVTRTVHADALHQAGRRDEAEARFREAELMQAESQPEYPLLYSLWGFRYCDLLLTEAERAAWQRVLELRASVLDCASPLALSGAASTPAAASTSGAESGGGPPHSKTLREVQERAAQTLKWMQAYTGAPLLDIALDHLTLGRAALYAAILQTPRRGELHEPPSSSGKPGAAEELGARVTRPSELRPSEMDDARRELDAAVSGLRRAGTQHEIPRALLTRAWQRSLTGALTGPESAQSDLDEAWEIAARGPMPLFLADIHLYRARLFGVIGDQSSVTSDQLSVSSGEKYPWESPEADLAEARRLIVKHGYLRRKEELEDAEKPYPFSRAEHS